MAASAPASSRGISIYFAFPDGVFHYVCAECNALCCRSLAFGGRLREVGQLLELYPALGSSAIARKGDSLLFLPLASGCVFLDGETGAASRSGMARHSSQVDVYCSPST